MKFRNWAAGRVNSPVAGLTTESMSSFTEGILVWYQLDMVTVVNMCLQQR